MDAKKIGEQNNSYYMLDQHEEDYYKYLISSLNILQNGEIITISFRKDREGKIIARGMLAVDSKTLTFSSEIETIDDINTEIYTILMNGYNESIYSIDKYILNESDITNICKMGKNPVAIKSIALFNTEKVSR